MVTLKNNFGVEPDKDSVYPKDMNVSEGSPNDAKSSASGHPKAILICRRNSHPFQARTIILNTPAKIGRSVARARPSSNNGIFDCKVLSRNHAIIWYDHDTGKFLIQDTKSSNGTFVNNQRLSKGGETSLPREFFSRDVVQFGVDVLENQRKGNEDSENSDESNHIVTHGCIVATVRLFHPNGKESKSGQPYSTPNPMTPIPQEKICKLELIIHEAQQREERLHDKLEELQLIISKLEVACQEALSNTFEETRLLSKIESLEKQTKVMNKIKAALPEKVDGEVQQLLGDIEKVQSVARDIQERQHRKLLESEQKLVEAQRVASNLELEVIALREQAALTESHLLDMGSKCTTYCQTIDTLKSNLHAQIELTQKLESEVAKFEKREAERDLNLCFSDVKILDKYKFITDESEEDVVRKDKEGQVILEWCKNYEEIDKIEEKDFINEGDKTEWLTNKLESLGEAVSILLEHISNCLGQLENSLMDVEKSRKNLEKLCVRKHELTSQLESAKMPVAENEKTEDELDGEKNELVIPVILNSLSNEKITELENELKEQEELVNEERLRQKESEGIYTQLRFELEATIKHCKKLHLESSTIKSLLRKHLKSMEESATVSRQKIVKLESEVEELEKGQEQRLVDLLTSNKSKSTETKEIQTSSVTLISTSTNTEPEKEKESAARKESTRSLSKAPSPPSEEGESPSSQLPNTTTDVVDNSKSDTSNLDNSSSIEAIDESKLVESFVGEVRSPREGLKEEPPWETQNLGVWEKIQKLQGMCSHSTPNEFPFSDAQITEMRSLMNLLAEDLVHLLLREQQIRKDKQSLQEKLEKSMSRNSISAIGLATHCLALVVSVVLLNYLGLAILRFFGLL